MTYYSERDRSPVRPVSPIRYGPYGLSEERNPVGRPQEPDGSGRERTVREDDDVSSETLRLRTGDGYGFPNYNDLDV